MNGEIGTLNQEGRQIGGFFDWSIDIVLDETIRHGVRELGVRKIVSASRYWLLEIPNSDIYEARFYKMISGQLVLMDEGQIGLGLPDKETLDRVLSAPLGMRWMTQQ